MTTTLAKEDVSQEFLAAVESAVGTGFGAWDMVDPREIVIAVLTAAAASRFDFSTAATANERRVRNVTLQAHARENERLREALKNALSIIRGNAGPDANKLFAVQCVLERAVRSQTEGKT